MKIAFIGQKGAPATYGGGVERYVEGVSQNLVKLGHQVFVYTRPYYTEKSKKKYKGVNLISLPTIKTKHIDAIFHTLVSTIHALFRDYDVIHYQGVGPSLLSFIPRILKPKSKVIVTFHSLDRNHAKWNRLAKFILTLGEWTACNFPHKTVTVSKGLQSYSLYKYNTPTTYIPNGVYKKDKLEARKILRKYNLKNKKYFLAAVRMVAHKRVDDIIKAFKKLPDQDIKLVIAGDSSYTDNYAKKIRKMAAEDDRIMFIGHAQAETLFPLMQESLAYVSASEDEGMPITVLEAMSLGAPVILSDIIGHSELSTYATLNLFKLKDTKALNSLLKQAIKDKTKWQKIAKANKKSIVDNYNWEDIAKSLAELYAGNVVGTQTLKKYLF